MIPEHTPATVAEYEAVIDKFLASNVDEPIRSAVLAKLASDIERTAWSPSVRLMAQQLAARCRAAVDPEADELAGLDALFKKGHLQFKS